MNKENKRQKIYEKNWFAIGLIVLVSIGIYHNSLNAPFVFDDIPKIVENPDIKQLSNIKTKLIYPYSKYKTFTRNDPSRPLTYLTFTLNYHFGKLNTFGYHLFNLLLHIFNSILIFFLTKKIILYTYKKDFVLFAAVVSLFFAVHPINTNVVSYIFARSGGLATFFYFLALLVFIKTFEKNRNLYAFSLLFFILSLLSKPIAVTFPVIVLVFDYIFLSDFKKSKVIEKIYYHIPFWILLAGYLLFRYFYLGGIGDIEVKYTWPIYSYFITQPYVVLKYLKLLLIPVGVCIDRGAMSPSGTIFDPKILISILLITGIFLLVWRISRKKTDISKIILFFTAWFFITLSPTSSIFPTTILMDDKRLYLSGFGFYFMVVFIYFLIFKIKPFVSQRMPLKYSLFSTGAKWGLFCLLAIHISLLGIITFRRNNLYQNPILLWQDVISKYPDNYKAHCNIGFLYYIGKEYDKALQKYQKVIELNPNHPEVHYNLGNLYSDKRDYNKALQEYQKAIELNPRYTEAHYNLGNLYYGKEYYNGAFQEYQKAIEINPKYAEAHYNLGNLYYDKRNYSKAIQEYQKAIELNPKYMEAHNNLGILYSMQGDYNKAVQEYQKTIEINPKYAEAHYNLGSLYHIYKDYKRALQELETALKLNPNDKTTKNKIKRVKEILNDLHN
ncbi:MAG: tetratricopeptide repeat protein [bacterium]